MGLWEHDTWLEEQTSLTKEQQAAVLQLVNDCITAGIKLGQSLEFKALKDDYAKTWDLIDKKKLNYVKRLAHMLEDAMDALPIKTDELEANIAHELHEWDADHQNIDQTVYALADIVHRYSHHQTEQVLRDTLRACEYRARNGKDVPIKFIRGYIGELERLIGESNA